MEQVCVDHKWRHQNMSTLCVVLGRADPGNVALQGTWLGLTGQSHFSRLPSWTGKVDFCHSKDKRLGLGLAHTTEENIEMVKLLQGAERRSWSWVCCHSTITGGGNSRGGSRTVLCILPFQLPKLCSKIPRKATSIPAAYFATSDSQLKWAFSSKPRNSFISLVEGKWCFYFSVRLRKAIT